jgi:hypothetical protein
MGVLSGCVEGWGVRGEGRGMCMRVGCQSTMGLSW